MGETKRIYTGGYSALYLLTVYIYIYICIGIGGPLHSLLLRVIESLRGASNLLFPMFSLSFCTFRGTGLE